MSLLWSFVRCEQQGFDLVEGSTEFRQEALSKKRRAHTWCASNVYWLENQVQLESKKLYSDVACLTLNNKTLRKYIFYFHSHIAIYI